MTHARTPGPWEVRTRPGGEDTVWEGGDRPFTIVHDGRMIAAIGQQAGEEHGNARLIAAAPALLAALEKVVACEDSGSLDDAYYDEHDEALAAARSALALARGKEVTS